MVDRLDSTAGAAMGAVVVGAATGAAVVGAATGDVVVARYRDGRCCGGRYGDGSCCQLGRSCGRHR